MVNLKVPGKAIRVLKIFWCSVEQQKRPPNGRETIARKRRHDQTLILLERAHIQRDLVVKQTDATTYDSAIRIRWRNGEAETWREVVVPADAVAIVTKAQV